MSEPRVIAHIVHVLNEHNGAADKTLLFDDGTYRRSSLPLDERDGPSVACTTSGGGVGIHDLIDGARQRFLDNDPVAAAALARWLAARNQMENAR